MNAYFVFISSLLIFTIPVFFVFDLISFVFIELFYVAINMDLNSIYGIRFTSIRIDQLLVL